MYDSCALGRSTHESFRNHHVQDSRLPPTLAAFMIRLCCAISEPSLKDTFVVGRGGVLPSKFPVLFGAAFEFCFLQGSKRCKLLNFVSQLLNFVFCKIEGKRPNYQSSQPHKENQPTYTHQQLKH